MMCTAVSIAARALQRERLASYGRGGRYNADL